MEKIEDLGIKVQPGWIYHVMPAGMIIQTLEGQDLRTGNVVGYCSSKLDINKYDYYVTGDGWLARKEKG